MESALQDLVYPATAEKSAVNTPTRHNLQQNPQPAKDVELGLLWFQLKTNLQKFCLGQFTEQQHFNIARHQAIETSNAFSGNFIYYDIFDNAAKAQPNDVPWLCQTLAYDAMLQADLITVFNDHGTPLHSYRGPAGWMVVISGELSLARYQEVISYDDDVNLLSKLQPSRNNRYHVQSGTLIDATSTPVVKMHARTQRCVLLNIYLRDNSDREHYFYFPNYRYSNQSAFFTRRVTANL